MVVSAGMGEMRKITVEVLEADLAAAQEYIGGGVTETVRAALAKSGQLARSKERLNCAAK